MCKEGVWEICVYVRGGGACVWVHMVESVVTCVSNTEGLKL